MGWLHVLPSVVRLTAGVLNPPDDATRWMPAHTALVPLAASSATGHHPLKTAAARHVAPPSVVARTPPLGVPCRGPAATPPAIQPVFASTNLTDV